LGWRRQARFELPIRPGGVGYLARCEEVLDRRVIHSFVVLLVH
jgi:hypothetical protein